MRVFITGGASGLGRALAERWAREKARVCIADVHDERGRETLESLRGLGAEAMYLRCDVTSFDDLLQCAEQLAGDWGGVDVVINNAGIANAGTIERETLEQWERILQVNLLGVVRGCKAFTPLFRKQGHGYFVNIASMAGLTHMAKMGSYCASKAGVVAFSETLALEFCEEKIGVTVVCPSFFVTNLSESLPAGGLDEHAKNTMMRLADASPLSAADVADLVYGAVKKRQFLLLPHPLGQKAHLLKRLLPANAYLRVMGRLTRSFRKGGTLRHPLDAAAVHRWLQSVLPDLVGEPSVSEFTGGASNWTYRLQYKNHDLVLRRPPDGTKAKSAHDMGREYALQKALKPVYPYVPDMVAHCADPSVIGAEFYVMRHVEGLIPRKQIPPVDARKLCHTMLDALVELHQVDYRAAGLEHLGAGAGYVARQVDGWIGRYQKARTWNVPRGRSIAAWLRANQPAHERICLTHNDFRLDNLVLDAADPTRIVAILDWELAALGDPLMDVGNLLAYWVQADDDAFARWTRRQPTHLPGMLTRAEVVRYYCERTGFAPADMRFYEVFGLFRLAGIAQQIYFRYHHGQVRNPAFRNFWMVVHYLHYRCRKLMGAR